MHLIVLIFILGSRLIELCCSKIFSPVKKVNVKNRSLSHNKIIKMMETLGHDEGGFCHGFILTWSVTVFLNKERMFFKNIFFMRHFKNDFFIQAPKLLEKLKTGEELTLIEKRLDQIKSFLNIINRAQSPKKYKTFYGEKLSQAQIPKILKKIALSDFSSNLKPEVLFKKTHAFNTLNMLKKMLNNIKSILLLSDKVVIFVSNLSHTVGFRPYFSDWLFLDINNLFGTAANTPHSIVSSEKLGKRLNKNLKRDNNALILTFTIISDKPNPRLSNELGKLNVSFPLKPDLLSIADNNKNGILTHAILTEDLKTIDELLYVDPQLKNIPDLHKAFVFIISNKFLHPFLRLFLDKPDIDTNTRIRGNATTPLGYAAYLGYTSLVKILINYPKTRINARDKKGNTALMLACKSTETKKKHGLFRALLGAGAQLYHKDKKGRNAIAIAREHKHLTAIREINIFAANNKFQKKQMLKKEPQARECHF